MNSAHPDTAPTVALHPDTERFLTHLDENAERFRFRVIHADGRARKLDGRPEDLARELMRANEEGAGVFVVVNADGHKDGDIQAVRAVFADLDGAPLKPVYECALEPSLIVATSPGKWHVYWLVDGLGIDQFSGVQRAIAARFDGDPSVSNLSRVMRLPGLYHRKGAPHLVRIIHESGGQPYAAAQVLAEFPPIKTNGGTTRAERLANIQSADGAIPAGKRDNHLTSLAGSMRRRGMTEASILAALQVENVRCDPPMAATDIQRIARSVARYPADTAGGERLPGCWPADEWPEPQPLMAKVTVEPYPVDALPDTIRAAVEEVKGFVKAPVAMVASSALAALSLASQAYANAKRADKLHGPSGLFLLTVADSGERKTTCDGFFTQAIRDHEEAQAEAARPALKNHKAAMAAWEAKHSGIKGKITQLAKAGRSTEGAESTLRDLEHDKPEPSRVPRLLYADATPEALAYGLAKNWPSGGVVSAEAGIVFGSHGMSKDSVMRNLGLLNQLWDGATLTIDRRSTESFTVRGARLTMALQVQEPTLREFLTRSGTLARGTGFLARFLVAWPESTQGFRPFTEAPLNWPHLATFNRRLAAILAQPVPIDEEGALNPPALSLTADAKAAWVEYHNTIERELASGGELYAVRDVASKSADNAVRLAALFQMFEGAGGAIGADAFERASRIAAWHLNESRRFFGELALPAELADAVRLDSWLIEYCRRNRAAAVGKNHVRQHGPLRDGERLVAAIRELAELDRVRLGKDGKRVIIQVNPALLADGGAS